jgi:ABC-type amino acid transport substrate-binding protein
VNVVWHGVLSSGPVNMVIPQGDKELQQALNGVINQMQADGSIDKIAIQYIGAQ